MDEILIEEFVPGVHVCGMASSSLSLSICVTHRVAVRNDRNNEVLLEIKDGIRVTYCKDLMSFD